MVDRARVDASGQSDPTPPPQKKERQSPEGKGRKRG